MRVIACALALTSVLAGARVSRAQETPEPVPPAEDEPDATGEEEPDAPAPAPQPAAPPPMPAPAPAPVSPPSPPPGPPPAGAPYGGPYAGPPYAQPGQPYWGPPPPPGPPPLEPEEPDCCRFGIRFDPFDLIFRRLSFQAEVKIWGPLSIEAEPSWIFGSATENLDTQGGALQGNFLVYFTGTALRGFYAKAIVGFEAYQATLTDPDLKIENTADIASPILGLGIGSSAVFGDDLGFNLAGGIGIGFATAEKKVLRAGNYEVSFYDKSSIVQLLASLGLGIAF